MRIKKFTGETLKIASDAMKRELGEEAIILDTRKFAINDGVSFFQREGFEITAAIDDEALEKSENLSSFADQLARASASQAEGNATADTAYSSLQKVAARFEHRSKEKLRPGRDSRQVDPSYGELKSEVKQLRAMLEEMTSQLKQTGREGSITDSSKLGLSIKRKPWEEPIIDSTRIEDLVAQSLALTSTRGQSLTSEKQTKVVALVGPSGVDKTNTFAKLAAVHKIKHKQDVAMIAAATHRIRSIEQLKTFAAMTDIPIEVVYRPSEMKAALSLFKGRDVVFIDAIGRDQGVNVVQLPSLAP